MRERRTLTPQERAYTVARMRQVAAGSQFAPVAGAISSEREAAVSAAFVVDTTTLPRAKVGGIDDPAVRWAGAFLRWTRNDAILDHRLRDRARRAARLAHRCDRGDPVHPRRHR